MTKLDQDCAKQCKAIVYRCYNTASVQACGERIMAQLVRGEVNNVSNATSSLPTYKFFCSMLPTCQNISLMLQLYPKVVGKHLVTRTVQRYQFKVGITGWNNVPTQRRHCLHRQRVSSIHKHKTEHSQSTHTVSILCGRFLVLLLFINTHHDTMISFVRFKC